MLTVCWFQTDHSLFVAFNGLCALAAHQKRKCNNSSNRNEAKHFITFTLNGNWILKEYESIIFVVLRYANDASNHMHCLFDFKNKICVVLPLSDILLYYNNKLVIIMYNSICQVRFWRIHKDVRKLTCDFIFQTEMAIERQRCALQLWEICEMNKLFFFRCRCRWWRWNSPQRDMLAASLVRSVGWRTGPWRQSVAEHRWARSLSSLPRSVGCSSAAHPDRAVGHTLGTHFR